MSSPNTLSPPGSFRELWRVALPLILSSGSVSLMHVIDRLFLTWHSTDALAAALPAGLLHWTFISLLIGTVGYVNTFVAQYDGAGRKDRVAASLWQGVYLAVCGAAVLLLLLPLSRSIFSWIGHPGPVQKLENEYFSIMIFGGTPMTLAATLACFYSGRGKTSVIMWVNFFGMGLNAVLDYCMIFGKGPFPEWGIRGAAVATVISQAVTALAYVGLICRTRNRDGYDIFRRCRFDRELFGRLLRYGLPNGLQLLGDIAGFAVFIFLIGKIGRQELAATNLAFTLNTLAFIPMIGVGTAVMTLVGRRIGEGRPELAVRTTWMAFKLCSVYMLAFAAVYVLLPDLILYPYALNSVDVEFEQLRGLVVNLLRFVALYSFFDGMVIIFGAAVRGAGDTRFSLVFTLLSAWLLMVLPTFVVWQTNGGSLAASWGSCTVYIVVLGIGFLIRFQRGRWKSMRVIEPTAGETFEARSATPEDRESEPLDAKPKPEAVPT